MNTGPGLEAWRPAPGPKGLKAWPRILESKLKILAQDSRSLAKGSRGLRMYGPTDVQMDEKTNIWTDVIPLCIPQDIVAVVHFPTAFARNLATRYREPEHIAQGPPASELPTPNSVVQPPTSNLELQHPASDLRYANSDLQHRAGSCPFFFSLHRTRK